MSNVASSLNIKIKVVGRGLETLKSFENEENIEKKNCANPVEEHQELISSVGISSTPSIFLPSGSLIQGYMSPEEVIQKIKNP